MRWNPETIDGQVLAVHAALVPTGHIVYFGGDEHDPDKNKRGDVNHTCLFDCATGRVTRISSPTTDVFCSGHAFLPDGSLLVAGGTDRFELSPTDPELHHEHFAGLRDAWIFDPWSQSWRRAASMNTRELTDKPGTPKDISKTGGRWYPTLITLPSGQVLAMAGHPGKSDKDHDNDTPEIFSLGGDRGRWRLLRKADPTAYYPRLHVLADGDVLCTTPVGDRTKRYDWKREVWVDICPAPDDRENKSSEPPGDHVIYNAYEGTSVLLPMHHHEGYRQRVLLCGSSRPLILDVGPTEWVEIGRGSPQPLEVLRRPSWQPTAPRSLAGAPKRYHLNAVLLPTGEVFVCGGIRPVPIPDAQLGIWRYSTPDRNAVLAAELYDPVTDCWSTLPEAQVARNYHSVALLMPDGRVWTAGSNHDGGRGPANRELRIEIFEPWYYSRPDRPVIQGIQMSPFAELPMTVTTPDAGSIAKVVLIRTGSCTHAFNGDQRYLSVPFQAEGTDKLRVDVPTNEQGLMPPGYYLVYLINQEGVPSVGHFVSIRRRESVQSVEPPLTYLDILGGIISDGGGVYVPPSGKVTKVPPRSPLRDMLATIVMRETARAMEHPQGLELQRAALEALAVIAATEAEQLGNSSRR